MSLTATQRDFIASNLGVFAIGGGEGPMDEVDSKISGALDTFLKQEGDVLKQIEEVRKLPGAEPILKELESDLAATQQKVAEAKREGGQKAVEDASASVDELQKKAKRVIDNKDVYASIDEAEKKLKALDEHAQRNHVDSERQDARNKVEAARNQAGVGDFTAAKNSVSEANTKLTDGKKYADDYETVIPVKASAKRIVASMKGLYATEVTWQAKSNAVDVAAAKAEPPTRNYTAAKNEMQAVITNMKTTLSNWYVTAVPQGLTDLKSKQTTLASKSDDGKTIVDADVTNADAIRQKIVDSIAASKWPEAILAAGTELPRLLTAANKAADRRLVYETQRETTTSDIQGLKDNKFLLGQMFSMNKLVEKADALASRETMRMEDGIKALQEVCDTCKALKTIVKDAEDYLTKRVEADERQTKLIQTPAAASGAIQDQIDTIDKLLVLARNSTGVIDAKATIVSGPNMEDHHAHQVDWKGASVLVNQALAALAAAEKLATDLKGTTDAHAAAQDADDLPKIEKIAGDLRKQAEDAKKSPRADKAEHEFTHVFASLDEALQQAKDGHIDIARIPLNGAAELLITAKTVLAERDRFETTYEALDERLTSLTTLTEPPAAQLKAKTDPIPIQMTKAIEQADQRNWDAAADLLRAAEAALAETEEFAKLRKELNKRATDATNAVTSFDAKIKKSIGDIITKATDAADDFNFAYARRFMDNAEAQIAGEKVKSKAASGTIDDDFEKALDKMMAAAGGEELFEKATDNPSGDRAIPNGPELLDKIVEGLPGDVKMSVIIAITKKRFGIDLSISRLTRTGGKDKDEIKGNQDEMESTAGRRDKSKRIVSAKKMYEMLALTPEQAKDNPSMKKVMRENAVDSDGDVTGGGYFSPSKNLVSMSGRPGDGFEPLGVEAMATQKDANGNAVRDDKGKLKKVRQLPDPVSDVYAPVGDGKKIDCFDFAAVHETGHAVDDRMGFMAARENQLTFGGWISHGSDIAAIAKKVTEKYGGAHADKLEEYVSDLIIGGTPDVPSVAPGDQTAVNDACTKIREWHGFATKGSPWWDHGKSTALAMKDGRVYHEAYSRRWVSYPLSERGKGITGYQFRAPGEWFAELYAAYHCGKLKPGHPARQWLSSLSL